MRSCEIACPSCNSRKIVRLGTLPNVGQFSGRLLDVPIDGGSLYMCHNCFLKFRYPLLGEEQYRLLYGNAKPTSWPSDVYREDWNLILDFIHTNVLANSKILDFGCWTGGLLSKLGDDYQKFGIEVNEAAADFASERINGKVWLSLDAVPQDLEFDVVTIVDVIEHLPDPHKLANQLMSKLKKNGYLVIVTGDADNFMWRLSGANWWYCFHPEHIAFISERWVKQFEQQGDFTTELITRFQHGKLSLPTYFMRAIQTILYSIFPKLYFHFFGLVRKILGRKGDVVGPAGVGLLKDHILVVLKKK